MKRGTRPNLKRKEEIVKLVEQGFSFPAIGKMYGLTRQGARWHYTTYKKLSTGVAIDK